MSHDSAAVRCAEWFVARNGYTLEPPADTNELARESIEVTSSWHDRLSRRRNTLAPRAVVLCQGARRGSGYTVAFARPADTTSRFGRVVTMDTVLGALRVEHVDFLLAEARTEPDCATVSDALQR